MAAADAARAPNRILVIEDEVLIRIVLAEELRDAGFAVIEAASAEEALSYLRSGAVVDLVFSDIRLPGPVDGAQLADQLRARYPLLPIMLTSGDYPGTYGPHGPDAMRLFIPKPYNTRRVIEIMFETLGAKRSGAGS